MGAATYLMIGAAAMLLLFPVWRRFFGFPAQKPSDYALDPGERFDLPLHLNGDLVCEGVIYGPTGRVVSRFTGNFEIRWTGHRAEMKEHFRYDSGEVQERQWNLELSEDGAIRATAEDVLGEGKGRQSGPAVQMRYKLRLPADAGGHVLSAIDWMYLTPDGTIMNRSQFRKFGVKVVELIATIRRKDAA